MSSSNALSLMVAARTAEVGREHNKLNHPAFDPQKEPTPIYDQVARMFQWDPRIDGSDTGPKNRLAAKKGHKPKQRRK